MSRRTSSTDRLLANELTERGVHVEPRQIERWRQAGFFSYERTYLGRGKGSASSFDPAVVDLVAELAEVLTQRRSLRDAVLILHARGRQLSPALVRAALATYLERAEAELRRVLARRAAGVAASDLLRTSKRGRQMQRHLSDSAANDDDFYDLVAGFLGEHSGWCSTLVSATGLTSIAGPLLDPETRAHLTRYLEPLSVPALRTMVMDASDEELRRAASDARQLLPFVAAFVELLARLAGRSDVLPLIGTGPLGVELAIGEWSALSIWARRRGLELDLGLDQAAEFGPALNAMLQLLRMFSFARGPLFEGNHEEKLAQLKPYERDSVVRRVRTFAEDNPELVETIRGASESGTQSVAQLTSNETRKEQTRTER
jgi:hypothetical protein